MYPNEYFCEVRVLFMTTRPQNPNNVKIPTYQRISVNCDFFPEFTLVGHYLHFQWTYFDDSKLRKMLFIEKIQVEKLKNHNKNTKFSLGEQISKFFAVHFYGIDIESSGAVCSDSRVALRLNLSNFDKNVFCLPFKILFDVFN